MDTLATPLSIWHVLMIVVIVAMAFAPPFGPGR
jgi:hypothetical protein